MATREQQITALQNDWDSNPRWKGVVRNYTAADVVRLRGSVQVEHTLAKRGAEIIEVRGGSSVGSAAHALISHVRQWSQGTPEGSWTSMAVASDGSYGVPEGLISSFPVTTSGGDWTIVQGLEIDDFSRGKIDASTAELADEREAVVTAEVTRERIDEVREFLPSLANRRTDVL